jgi:hypothetical protein
VTFSADWGVEVGSADIFPFSARPVSGLDAGFEVDSAELVDLDGDVDSACAASTVSSSSSSAASDSSSEP